MFQEFVTASKNVPRSSVQNYTSIVLAGHGAYATQGPTTLAPDPSTTSLDYQDRLKVAVFAMAILIGAVQSVFFLSLLCFILYRRHRQISERRATGKFFRYKGRSLDLGKRLSFVPSRTRMVATALNPPPLVPGDSEWRTHLDDSPIGYISLPTGRGSPDPVLKPKSRIWGVEPGKNTSPAGVIVPPRPLGIRTIPTHASAVPGPAPGFPSHPRSGAYSGPGSTDEWSPAASPIITPDLTDTPPRSTSTSTSNTPSSAHAGGKTHRDPSLPPTTSKSGTPWPVQGFAPCPAPHPHRR